MTFKSDKIVVFLKPSEAIERATIQTPCPSGIADHRMVVRRNKATQQLFGGCSKFPACSESVEVCLIPEAQLSIPGMSMEAGKIIPTKDALHYDPVFDQE